MAKTRYFITEHSESDGITEYHVGIYLNQPDYEQVGVWVGGDGMPRCVECQGRLVAMSASCVHAKAVKRFLGIPQQGKS